MKTHKNTDKLSSATKPWDELVQDRVQSTKTGVVEVTVHDSSVVQIETKQLFHFEEGSVAPGSQKQ